MNFSPELKVWSTPLTARRDVRGELARRIGSVPEEYVEIAAAWDDLEFELRGQYFRIRGGLRALDYVDGYRFRELLPGSIPVGDDGGGRFLAYFDGQRGPGIYRGGFGDIDPNEVRWVARSLTDMLQHPESVEWDWDDV